MGRKKIKIEKITNARQKMVSIPNCCGSEDSPPRAPPDMSYFQFGLFLTNRHANKNSLD